MIKRLAVLLVSGAGLLALAACSGAGSAPQGDGTVHVTSVHLNGDGTQTVKDVDMPAAEYQKMATAKVKWLTQRQQAQMSPQPNQDGVASQSSAITEDNWP